MTERLDSFLVKNGMTKSRERSKELIKNNGVKVNNITINKPSYQVDETDKIDIVLKQIDYVGRGGLKLERAIVDFEISLDNKICVDLGASTGGFTHCMLKFGAKQVFAVDVGHGQLDTSLVENSKVVNLEGINVKDFGIKYTSKTVDFISADLSFISIRSALPIIEQILKKNELAVILIKPQFEVGKSHIGKGGIVKDKKAHILMLTEILSFIENLNMTIRNLICSPITGGDGNIEYLCCIKNISNENNSYLSKNNLKTFVDNTFIEMK